MIASDLIIIGSCKVYWSPIKSFNDYKFISTNNNQLLIGTSSLIFQLLKSFAKVKNLWNVILRTSDKIRKIERKLARMTCTNQRIVQYVKNSDSNCK